jgi:hypothetical protein
MSGIRHRPPVPIVSWCGPLQWVNPLQPSVRSVSQSYFSLLLCWCSSSVCNMGLLWFPSLSWWFILFSWMISLMNGTRAHLWSSAVLWTGFVAFWLYAICWPIPIFRFHRSRYALWLSFIEVLYFLATRVIFFRWTNIWLRGLVLERYLNGMSVRLRATLSFLVFHLSLQMNDETVMWQISRLTPDRFLLTDC